ncbi:MAG TPA: hypothetical protein VFV81_02390 [Verrucomicrobiae bacterium]|nr:hypothetical protein [Verrucomicrobiae bacterium]
MNNPSPADRFPELLPDLRSFTAVAEDLLRLARREHEALNGDKKYELFEFCSSRKDLIVQLDSLMLRLRRWRRLWQELDPAERAGHSEVTTAIQMLRDLIVKILQLDRENQQAFLRRGLVPAAQVQACAAPPTHYVANLYRRHHPH